MSCRECGGADCGSAFDRSMALEMTDPEYGQVHHLTVPAFMVQHPSRLSAYGWRAEVGLLREIVAGLGPDDGRRRPREGPSLVRGGPIEPPTIRWSRTICDLRFDDPAVYREDVAVWAQTVAREAPHL